MAIGDEEAVGLAEKRFDLKELLANLGKLKRRENDHKNEVLEQRFPDRYVAEYVGGKGKMVDVQIASAENKGKGDTILVKDVRGEDVKVDVVANVWLTDTTKGVAGKGNAVCYSYGKDGKWYVQEASKYKHNEEKRTNVWEVSRAQAVSNNVEELHIKGLLEAIAGGADRIDAKSRSQQDYITLKVQTGSVVTVS